MSAVEAVVEAAEVVDEVVEAVEHINNLNGTTRKQQIIVLVTVAVGAAVISGTASHFVTKKLLSTKYERLMEEELEKTREFFANRTHVAIDKSEPVIDPEELLNSIDLGANKVAVKTDYAALSRNEFVDDAPHAVSAIAQDVDEVKVVEKSVFESDVEDDWVLINDQNAGQKKPHVISKDDFYDNDNDWGQFTFTYFAGDDVLADEKEDMVPDYDAIVGSWNLERFGWLSEDSNTVFIRVPAHNMEIEVIRSEGTFAAEVHGFQHGEDSFEKRRKGGRVRFGDD